MMGQLSLQDRQLVTRHLEDCFDEPGLKRLLRLQLNKRLDHITTAAGNYPQIVLAVVDKAEQESFLPDLLRAVISEREFLRRDLQGILDRCGIDPRFRPQIDALREILRGRPQLSALARHCFQESRSPYSHEWVQPKGEVSTSGYADHLATFVANDKECYPVLRYVHLLIERGHERGLDDQEGKLQTWLEKAAHCLAEGNESLAQQLVVAAREPEQQPAAVGVDRPPTLFVQIEPSGVRNAPLKISMWFIPPKSLDLPRAELMTLRNLKSTLQDRLRKIAEEFDWADLEVHFMLPGKLLVDWDADQWPLPVEDLPLEPELGYFCRVLIRPLERTHNRIMLNSLKRRWKELTAHPHTPCEWLDCLDIPHRQSHVVICMPPQCQHDLHRRLGQAESVLGAALYPAPGPLKANDTTATLYHLFLEGVPAIFWLRSTAAAPDADRARTTLKALVADKCLGDLPHTVWDLRRKLGPQYPITLIWDDPDWLPEVIERQAALRSEPCPNRPPPLTG